LQKLSTNPVSANAANAATTRGPVHNQVPASSFSVPSFPSAPRSALFFLRVGDVKT